MKIWLSGGDSSDDPNQTGWVLDTEGRYITSVSNSSEGITLEEFEKIVKESRC